MSEPKYPAPDDLDAAGQAVWESITSTYDLRPDERLTLGDICRLTDDYEETRSDWIAQGKPRTTTGSMGQLVAHPDRLELRANIAARNALWRQLKLPDLPALGAEAGAKPNQHRSAANSKWAAAHGTGS